MVNTLLTALSRACKTVNRSLTVNRFVAIEMTVELPAIVTSNLLFTPLNIGAVFGITACAKKYVPVKGSFKRKSNLDGSVPLVRLREEITTYISFFK